MYLVLCLFTQRKINTVFLFIKWSSYFIRKKWIYKNIADIQNGDFLVQCSSFLVLVHSVFGWCAVHPTNSELCMSVVITQNSNWGNFSSLRITGTCRYLYPSCYAHVQCSNVSASSIFLSNLVLDLIAAPASTQTFGATGFPFLLIIWG